MLRSSVLLALLLVQGCSLIFVNGPPEGHERLRYFDCASNGAGVAGDASWAVMDGLFAAALASANGDVDSNGKKMNTGAAAALFGVGAAVHAGSLIYGLVQGHRCADAKQQLQQRMADSDRDTKAQIERLQQQIKDQARATAAPAEPPRTLELAPAPTTDAPPADPAAPLPAVVPPPPATYTQPPPGAPAPAKP
jgi:hypothetical protein